MSIYAAKRWIITGPREVGKTRFCQNLLQQAEQRNLDATGIICPPVFENQIKTEIAVVDVRTNEIRQLARVRTVEEVSSYNLRWVFDEEVMAWGNGVLQSSTPCELLFMDELGPLEFEKNAGWQEGILAINRCEYHAAIVVIRPELVHLGIAHWPDSEVIVIPPYMSTEIERSLKAKIFSPFEL